MNDEQFETTMKWLPTVGLSDTAAQLRARDASQREALARVEAERDAERARGDAAVGDANEAESQLAEAVGLLRELSQTPHHPRLAARISELIHAQAEQQEAHEVGPLKGEFAEVAEQAFREQYGLQEAQGAQAVDAQKEISELIGFEFKPGEMQTVTADELLRVFWKGATLATQPAAPVPDWKEWDGERCPLAPYKPVKVRYRNGEEDSGQAINFNWYHNVKPHPYDIVSYQVAVRGAEHE